MRSRTWIALCLALVPAAAIPLAAVAMSGGTPSFTRDVAPIIADKCAGCHQTGGIAPFPLETAKQISSRAGLIGAAVQARVMPPWPPGQRSPAYVGQGARTLSAQQRATIVAWAAKGGKVDGAAREPAAPARPARAARREAAEPPDAGRLPAVGAEGRHRRLPLLPPRPEAGRRRVGHVGADRAGPGEGRASRDPLPRRCRAGLGREGARPRVVRAGLVVLRRHGPARRRHRRGHRRLPEQRELDRRVGARLGREPASRGDGSLASGREPDRDAGALQPPERQCSRPLARAAHRRAGVGGPRAVADDAPPRPGRARLREGRGGAAVRPHRSALRPRPEVRIDCRLHARRPADPVSRIRRDSTRERRVDLRPPDLDADDHPRRRGPHAPARLVDPARAEPRHTAREGAARHPALGLPLAERVHPRALGRGGTRATSYA